MDEHQKITSIVHKIASAEMSNKDEYFSEIYKGFKKKYPHLFALACKQQNTSTDDMQTLKYMLDMMEKVRKNEGTQEAVSAEVGQTLFNRYVDVSKLKPAQDGKGGINIVTTPCKESDT